MGKTQSKQAGRDMAVDEHQNGHHEQTEGGFRLFNINNNDGGGVTGTILALAVIVPFFAAVTYGIYRMYKRCTEKCLRQDNYKAYYRNIQESPLNLAPRATLSEDVRRYGPDPRLSLESFESHTRRQRREARREVQVQSAPRPEEGTVIPSYFRDKEGVYRPETLV